MAESFDKEFKTVSPILGSNCESRATANPALSVLLACSTER